MLLAASLAFFQVTGANKVDTKAASPFFVDKKESWIVRDKFYTDSECNAEKVTKSDYYKISSDCDYQNSFSGCNGGSIPNYVDYKGWRYFTLRDSDPYSESPSCDSDNSYYLHSGWEIAPDDDDSRAVASDHYWQSAGLFLANGKLVVTRSVLRDGGGSENFDDSRDNGQVWYKTDFCEYYRIDEDNCYIPSLLAFANDWGNMRYGVSGCDTDVNILVRARVPGYVKMSCHTDPSTSGIYVTRSSFGEDQNCFGDASDAHWQESFFLDSLPTQCNDGSGDLWGANNGGRKLYSFFSGYKNTFTGYPLVGSEIFRCENLDSRELPFDANAANTIIDIGYINDNCNMDAENVKVASVLHINECLAFDIRDGYGHRLDDDAEDDDDDWASYALIVNSIKVSGCGYDVDFYTDDRCQDRAPQLSTSWRNSHDFDCKTGTYDDDDDQHIRHPDYDYGRYRRGLKLLDDIHDDDWDHKYHDDGNAVGGKGDDDHVLKDLLTKHDDWYTVDPGTINMKRIDAVQSFCAVDANDAGDAKKGKLSGNVAPLSEDAMKTLHLYGKDDIFSHDLFNVFKSGGLPTGRTPAADSVFGREPEPIVSSNSKVAPMNYAYAGLGCFVSAAIGAIVASKIVKSRSQFEGVEMQSAHSAL